jgi:hypothetical protein
MMRSRFATVMPTSLDGLLCLRLCTINPATREADLESTIRMLGGYASEYYERHRHKR